MEIKCLSIQIQLGQNPQFNKEDFLRRVKSINRFPEVDEGDDSDPLLNFNFFTEIPSELWRDLNSVLYNDKEYGPIIKTVSIVVCEGNQGWDDYLLLHHYDDSEKIDSL